MILSIELHFVTYRPIDTRDVLSTSLPLLSLTVLQQMQAVKLIATPLSHFGRKSRLLLDLYKIPYSLHDVGQVAFTKQPGEAGGHPLLKVPVLLHGDEWLIESDHISGYIVDKVDEKDRYRVHSRDIFDLNAKAVMNGVMTEEVKILVAGRHKVPWQQYSYFNRCLDGVKNGLQWLEAHHHKFRDSDPHYRDLHLVCLLDHLEYYDFVPMKPYPNIVRIAKTISDENDVIRQTAPHVQVPKSI